MSAQEQILQQLDDILATIERINATLSRIIEEEKNDV
jgi:hypothetical protein